LTPSNFSAFTIGRIDFRKFQFLSFQSSDIIKDIMAVIG